MGVGVLKGLPLSCLGCVESVGLKGSAASRWMVCRLLGFCGVELRLWQRKTQKP